MCIQFCGWQTLFLPIYYAFSSLVCVYQILKFFLEPTTYQKARKGHVKQLLCYQLTQKRGLIRNNARKFLFYHECWDILNCSHFMLGLLLGQIQVYFGCICWGRKTYSKKNMFQFFMFDWIKYLTNYFLMNLFSPILKK